MVLFSHGVSKAGPASTASKHTVGGMGRTWGNVGWGGESTGVSLPAVAAISPIAAWLPPGLWGVPDPHHRDCWDNLPSE